MSGNRVKQVANGLMWTYAERTLAQIITILVTIVLSRLIAPSDYGMIAIVNVFINIANAFVINGFGNSLVQKKDADELDFSTVFYFSIIFSLIIYFIIYKCSTLIASFYKMPELKIIIRIMAVRIPIAAINSVQQAYISKKMEFKKFFFATLGGTLFSAIVGISMAYLGLGIWSLVAQYLSNVCIDTLVLWFVSGWRPHCIYSSNRMKSLFSYGWKIMCVGVMTTLYSSLRNLIIGKKYTSTELAFSEKGEQFPSAISGNINSSIIKVLFPVLSNSQNNLKQLKGIVRRSIKIGSYVLFPILLGFMMVAEPFVKTLLTEKWTGCIPFLQIMCFVYAMQPMQTASLQSMKALGKSNLYLWIDILKKLIGITVLLITVLAFDKVLAIILGSLIVELLSVVVLFPVNKKLLRYGYKEQLTDILPTVILVLVMCLAIRVFSVFIPVSGWLELVVEILLGISVYIGLSIISKNENYYYILGIIRGLLSR